MGSEQATGPRPTGALTPEFQTVLEASLKDQAAGGQGNDPHVSCLNNDVPRIMTATSRSRS